MFDDFSGEENYYKLLADFNPYDCITEEAAPQGDVKQVYPEGFEDILRSELKGQEGHRQEQEKNQAFDKAMGEIESYLQTHTKADTVYYAEQHGINLGAKDKKLDAAGKERLKQLQKEGASFKLSKKADPEGYDTTNLHWAISSEIISEKDQAVFWEAIANINKRRYNSYARTKNGGYIIETDNVMMFTDADWKAPTLSKVIVFPYGEYVDTSAERAMIRNEARKYGTTAKSTENVESIFGPGFVSEFHKPYRETYGREDGNREGKDGSTVLEESNSRGVRYDGEDGLLFGQRNKLPVGEDTSPRALLANAFEGVVQNDIEKRNLEKYQSRVAELDEEEAKLRELRAQIKELSFAKGPRDKAKLSKLRTEANATANRTATLDKMLLRFEASAPLQEVIRRKRSADRRTIRKKGEWCSLFSTTPFSLRRRSDQISIAGFMKYTFLLSSFSRSSWTASPNLWKWTTSRSRRNLITSFTSGSSLSRRILS